MYKNEIGRFHSSLVNHFQLFMLSGTVFVQPEAVEENAPAFHGPEFSGVRKSAYQQSKSAASNSPHTGLKFISLPAVCWDFARVFAFIGSTRTLTFVSVRLAFSSISSWIYLARTRTVYVLQPAHTDKQG